MAREKHASLTPVEFEDLGQSTRALSDDDIYERIIDAVIDQRLLPGTRLGEDKLGQVFGVSRTRIRQVLIRLAHEQVVTLQPNKGATVAQPTVEDAREVFEARAVIEAVLVQRFMALATPADLQALADCIEAEEEARREADHADALRLSGRFHLMIAEAAQHQTFARMLKKLISRTSLILMSYGPLERVRPVMGQVPVRWVDACRCDAHRSVLQALCQRDALTLEERVAQATGLMRQHLSDIEAGLCFNQAEPPAPDLHTLFGQDRAAQLASRRGAAHLLQA